MVDLFEQGCKQMHSHRFAISAFHHVIERKIIGEHPQVSSLITGIFNYRPLKPRHNVIWDVQLVIYYLKKDLSDNKKLTDKQLTFKVPMLLALTFASCVSGLLNLDIGFMARTENKNSFHFNKLNMCTSLRRKANNQTQLLLGHIKPHKEVVSSTIPGWVKATLKLVDINVDTVM